MGFTRSNSALVDSGDSRSASLPPTNTQRSSGRGSCSLMYCTARPTRPVPPVTRMTFSAAICDLLLLWLVEKTTAALPTRAVDGLRCLSR